MPIHKLWRGKTTDWGCRKGFSIVLWAGMLFVMGYSCAGQKQVMRPVSMIKDAEYVGKETCRLCHEDRVRDFAETDHGRIQIDRKGEEDIACESCHGAGSLHVEVGGGRGRYIVNPGSNEKVCFTCHLYIKAAFRLQYRHPLIREGFSCTSCHNPHGRDIYLPEGVAIGKENAVCRQCHREQARPRVFAHEALREGCVICHKAHGSINDKMLVENDNVLCLKCHAQLASPGTVVIGDFAHTSRLMEGPCWSAGCHTAVHGSDINPHLRY